MFSCRWLKHWYSRYIYDIGRQVKDLFVGDGCGDRGSRILLILIQPPSTLPPPKKKEQKQNVLPLIFCFFCVAETGFFNFICC